MSKKERFLQILFTLLLIVAIVVFVPDVRKISSEDIRNLLPESLIISGFIIFGFYVLKAFTMVIPFAVLYVTAGIVYEPLFSLTLTTLFLSVELTISFYIGRFLGSRRLQNYKSRNRYIERMMDKSSSNGIINCFLLRLIPGPPADMVSMLLGASETRWLPFLIGSLMALAPTMIPTVLIGEAITDPLSIEFLIPLIIMATMILLTSLIYWVRFKRNGSITKEVSYIKEH